MRQLSIRNVPEEIHCALRVRAAKNNRSLEAELRAILADAARNEEGVGIGTALQIFGREHGGIEFENNNDSPVQPANFT
jgi:plasmid stability protein